MNKNEWIQRPQRRNDKQRLKIEIERGKVVGGAGEGNRTPVVSLGSFCSTIELHPHLIEQDCTRIFTNCFRV